MYVQWSMKKSTFTVAMGQRTKLPAQGSRILKMPTLEDANLCHNIGRLAAYLPTYWRRKGFFPIDHCWHVRRATEEYGRGCPVPSDWRQYNNKTYWSPPPPPPNHGSPLYETFIQFILHVVTLYIVQDVPFSTFLPAPGLAAFEVFTRSSIRDETNRGANIFVPLNMNIAIG